MSADNGVYILQTKHPTNPNEFEYRVSYGFESIMEGITKDENWEELPDQEWNEQIVKQLFKNCDVFYDSLLAYECAEDIQKDSGYTEYGICIFYFPNKVFPR